MTENGAEAEYHSKDFDFEELSRDVHNDPSLRHHLLPFESSGEDVRVGGEEGSDAWRKFHARHYSGKFFKERRYLLKEFPELAVPRDGGCKVLEVGCGNGSTVLPILRGNENVTLYACDCSVEALDYAKQVVDGSEVASFRDRFYPFQCDFSHDGFPSWLSSKPCQETTLHTELVSANVYSNKTSCYVGGMDFVTLIFTLSAIPFKKMPMVLAECFSVLKAGGMLLFRDYGLYDMTMLRFKPDQRVGFQEYIRADGTRSYFFCLHTVRDLFLQAGFTELELEYCCVKSINRRKEKIMRRVWVHGKFRKAE
ncbi:hypothetical protein MLD38_020629 [Melastoma candidum]|uniref:Uncharacterized protein n=1 Tax=Melastoma candidum TaxID=119954 RepID=A0ACB9QDN7_9MYRT|nr:hypothetical protein MLD38_020629 [Melastoma candidum]